MRKRQFEKAMGISPKYDGIDLGLLFNREEIIGYYKEKYFNLFMSSYEIKDDGNATDAVSRYYMMKQFFFRGTVATYRIKNTGLLGFAPYSVQTWDMYSSPSAVNLINERGVSLLLVPDRLMTVGKDVVIGWYQRNHRPIYRTVIRYAEQLADVQMVINTNLQLHKMPFLIACDDEDVAKRLKDVVRRIVNNDIAVYLNAADKNALVSMVTATPYIIDKLYQYKIDLENELKTYLGLDNQGNFEKKERMLTDEVQSQRATIDDSADNFSDCLNEFSEAIKEVLGISLKFIPRQKQNDEAVDHKADSHRGGDNNAD